jgi:hypothetical protein
MITDFKNPHKQIQPIRVEEAENHLEGKDYRIAHKQGLYRVEVSYGSGWTPVIDITTEKSNLFQTLGEAENFLERLNRPPQYFYY